MSQRVVILVFVGAAIAAWAFYLFRESSQPELPAATTTVAEIIAAEDTTGYARALAPRRFSFPADHGPHPAYRIEWWYYTGNLETDSGRHFGYQLTFFRFALTPEPPQRESKWSANHVHMAHLTVTDVDGGKFHAFERLSRDALALAGSKAEPFSVWLEGWSAEGAEPDGFPMRLRAVQDKLSPEKAIGIELTLEQGKPVVLQGARGLSQKSSEPGNASYYYSLTRMPTEGTIQIQGKTFQVRGLSWMDREWSTSALGKEQVGWDWFALQLSDEREVMYYRLRQRDGRTSPFSEGVLVERDGTSRTLGVADVAIDVLDEWQSGLDKTQYPSRWRLQIPSEGIDLNVEPYLADQELNLSVRYWEGAVRVRGTAGGKSVTGSGYVELTGFESISDFGFRISE